MTNKYNIYKVLIAIIAVLCVAILALPCLIKNPNLNLFQELLQSGLEYVSQYLKWGLFVLVFFLTGDILQKIVTQDSMRNILKSHMATHTLRKFAHTFGSKRNINSPTETNVTVPKGKANRSLQTLVVTYYNDSATMKIKLPANHEGQKTIKALFPDMKAELNGQDSNFLFSDIVIQKKRIYHTTAKRVVDRG